MKNVIRRIKMLDKPDLSFFCFLIIFVAISAFLLNTPPTTDEGTHSLIALFFRDFTSNWISHPTFSFSKIYDYTISYLVHYPKLSLYYPPLLHITVSLFYKILGVSFFTGRFVVLLFSIGTLIILYKTVKHLFNGKVALLSTSLFSLMPMVYYNSITMMTDIPYTFFFMLAMYFYLNGFGSKEKKHFIIAAISASLAFLTKWNAILIAPIIFAYAFLEKRDQMKNVIMSLTLIFFIVSPYLLVIWKTGLISLPFISSLHTSATAKQDPQFNTIQGWLYYLNVLMKQYLTIPLFLASILAMVFFSLKREKYWKLFLIWSLVFYLFFTLLSNKEPRYMIPIVPALVIPLSFFIVSQKYKFSIPIAVIFYALILYSTWQLISGTFYYEPDFTSIAKETLKTDGNILVVAEPGWFYSSQFMFALASMDYNTSKFVFRPCSLSSTSLDNLASTYGVRYVILPEPTNRDIEKASMIKSSSRLDVSKIFSTDTTNTTLYTHRDYKPQKEYCNFVCVLNSTICTKYPIPSNALK